MIRKTNLKLITLLIAIVILVYGITEIRHSTHTSEYHLLLLLLALLFGLISRILKK